MASKNDNWMQQLWRPMMGWMYMLICLLDMAVFPVLWSLLQAMMHAPITQWNPLTLQGAGLFHIAMGAVLGIAAFGRTQEKLAGTAANPTATVSTQNMNMTGNTAGGFGSNQGMGSYGSAPSYSAPSAGFGGAPAFGAPSTGFEAPSAGFGGAPAFGAPSTGFGAPSGGFGSPAPSGGFSSPAPSTGSFGSSPSVNAKGQKVIPQDPQPAL
jgi:hypothetical protein